MSKAIKAVLAVSIAVIIAASAFIGGYVQDRFPLYRIRLVAGAILAILAIWTVTPWRSPSR